MKFVIIGRVHARSTPEIQAASIARFGTWAPPPGLTINYMAIAADHTAVFLNVETDSSEDLMKAAMEFEDCLEFQMTPVVESSVALPIVTAKAKERLKGRKGG